MAKRPLCGADKRQGEGTCTRPAGWGVPGVTAGPCKLHGGATRSHKRRSEQIMAEDALAQAVTTFGLEVECTAEDALLSALARSKGLVLFYQARVRNLPPDQLVYGSERVTRRRRPNLEEGGEVIEDVTVAKSQVNVWVRLLQEAESHHLKVAAAVAGLGIEERRLRLAEEQGALFFDGMLRVLEAFGISPDDDRIPLVIPAVMGEIVG